MRRLLPLSSLTPEISLQAQLNKTLGDASVVVKFSCAIVCLFYFLSFIPDVYAGLAVTPGLVIPPNFRIWTLITGGFIEYRCWNILIDIFVLVLCGKLIEPLWGALEFLKFVMLLNVGSSIVTVIICLIIYMATFNINIWFLKFSGMTGVVSGVLVAFKQVNPNTEIKVGPLNIRVKAVPSLVVMLYILLCVTMVFPMILLAQVLSGTLIGWVYLRFYQPRGKGVKGDLSETFSFASFFPEVTQSSVNVLSIVVFNILVKLGLCTKPVRTYDVGAPSAITISLPGMDPADAERRRQKALKALNERLKKLEQPSSWPSMDGAADKETEMEPSSPGPPPEDVPEISINQGSSDHHSSGSSMPT